MIPKPVPNPQLTFAERFGTLLADGVGPNATLPANVLALDTVAREAMADADAALSAYRYADAQTAVCRIDMARREIRDIFDAGQFSNALTPILQCSAKWARVAEQYRAALKSQRGW